MDKGSDGRGVYRAIYVNLWDQIEFCSLPANAKFVFVSLRTCPHSNMICLFPFYIEGIQKWTGLSRKDIQKALDVLYERRWIVIEDGLVWIRNGLKYDPNISLSNSLHLKAIKKILLGLPKSKLVEEFCAYYGIPYPIGYGKPFRYPIPITETDTETETEPETEPESETEPERLVELFNNVCTSLARVSELSQSRRNNLKARIKEHPDLLWWKKVFEKANKSSVGEDGKRWIPTFDWLVKDDTNAMKVLEGQFERKPRGLCDYSKYRNIEDDTSTEESETAESQESVET